MIRNIFNVTEISAAVDSIMSTAIAKIGDKSVVAPIKKWVTTTFKNYVVREYRVSKWIVHSQNEEFVKTLNEVLPMLLTQALKDNYDDSDDDDSKWKTLRSHVKYRRDSCVSAVIEGVCQNASLSNVEVLRKAPEWVKPNGMYGIVDVTTIKEELSDLLDVMASDWFSAYRPKLSKMSVDDVHNKHKEWVKCLAEQADSAEDQKGLKVLHNFEDGSTLVELTTEQCMKREGKLMSHCISGSGYLARVNKGTCRILSLRTADNKPVLTFEVDVENKVVTQMRGKANRLALLSEVKFVKAVLDEMGIMINATFEIPKPESAAAGGGRAPVRRRRPPVEEEEDEEEDDDDEEEYEDQW